MELDKFEEFLSQGNMAKNTISAYLYAVKEFGSRHKELNKRNLLVYKTYLIETYKPKTVNLRIQALNKYLVFVGKTKLRLKSVKVQQRSYFGECHQQCRLHLLEEQVEEGRELGVVLCGAFLSCDWCQSERTCANQG